MSDQNAGDSTVDGVDHDAPPLVGQADAEADAARAGKDKDLGDRLNDAVDAITGSDQNRDSDGVPVGGADADADAQAAGAGTDRA